MLQVINLVKEYKNFRAVDHLNFEVRPGEIVGLLGPNGAGKTTAMRCVAGILRPNGGHILINGFDLDSDQARAKGGLAFVPELPSLYELLTVEEHIKFVAMCFNTLEAFENNVDSLLDRYHLAAKRNDLVATLSKGMRQKLAIACAMVHNANVFLFDEPVIGIDPQGVAEFKDELRAAKARNATILVSTHLLDTAEKLCDRVVILNKGKTIASGTLAELQTMEHMEGQSLEHIFLELTDERGKAPVVFDL
ncbi:MAG: ABC transporter ATP-binding protein [Fimbriimonadaceae bacterium]